MTAGNASPLREKNGNGSSSPGPVRRAEPVGSNPSTQSLHKHPFPIGRTDVVVVENIVCIRAFIGRRAF